MIKRRFAQKPIDALLRTIEKLNEVKTGKPAFAKAQPVFVLGIGYTKDEDEYGVTESYLLPFTLVQIYTPKSSTE